MDYRIVVEFFFLKRSNEPFYETYADRTLTICGGLRYVKKSIASVEKPNPATFVEILMARSRRPDNTLLRLFMIVIARTIPQTQLRKLLRSPRKFSMLRLMWLEKPMARLTNM